MTAPAHSKKRVCYYYDSKETLNFEIFAFIFSFYSIVIDKCGEKK